MPEKLYYYDRGEGSEGPIPAAEIRAMLADGRLPDTISVKTDAMLTWVPAATYPAFGVASGEGAVSPAEPGGTTLAGPTGIGGWLVLVALGLIVAPLRILALLVSTHLPIFQQGMWAVLTTPGSEAYHPLWAPLLIFEILGNLALVAAYIVMNVLFWNKSVRFPRLFIGVALGSIAFILADAVFASFVLTEVPMFDSDTTTEVARAVLAALIWVPYMLRSRRVRNTFVKGRPSEDAASDERAVHRSLQD